MSDHGHDHSGHTHAPSAEADRNKLAIALALILAFMLCEVVVGALAHSLALLSDAGHMLTDAAAIGLALVAIRMAARPAAGVMTYGFKRAEILSAQANGITLLVLGILILYEAVRRLIAPPAVQGLPVVVVALAGIGVNLVASWVLASANRQSLNVEGSFQHIVTDLYAFIATAVAGAIILATGFTRADPIASLLVAALMFRAAYGLLRESGRIFLEASPRGIDPSHIAQTLADQPYVVEVHDFHVWEVSSGFPALTAHVIVEPGCDCHATRQGLAELIGREFHIHHTTLQVDHARRDSSISLLPRREKEERRFPGR